eukprot:TRINITY_DN8308_c0_g1_i1.p1 TRINITY_DN8308_c0_g1~~TRINITY_DN8308_c0_g1_i1.p1  ORF type:complete len:262 (+),score=69.89 TRINITY_DN8308_c0_g1_i1:105-890(+)
MKFRPCIDIRKGQVTQIVGSTLSSDPLDSSTVKTNFNSELPSSHYAELYKTHGLTGGHVIKLGPEPENDATAKLALETWPGGLQIGGGVTAENARRWLDAGASHVIVTSFVFRGGDIDFKRLDELEEQVEKNKLVLDLSCKKVESGEYVVATDRWTKLTRFSVDESNLALLGGRCAEFLIHAVDVEGKQQGIEEDLLKILSASMPAGVGVTYAGGVRSIEDLELIKTIGAGRVDATIGSALDIFGGNLSFDAVVEWNSKQT